jgi:hypothetical protein
MKDISAEVASIRQQGMEKAATIWETFENLPTPFSPVNIFKAACSIKCAEFVSRIRSNDLLLLLSEYIGAFLDETLAVAGTSTEAAIDEGMRVVDTLEKEMPLTDEIFEDPARYATRQHVYDGLIMLSAAKMGKEKEAKGCIDRLQSGVSKAMLMAMIQQTLADALKKNIGDPADE